MRQHSAAMSRYWRYIRLLMELRGMSLRPARQEYRRMKLRGLFDEDRS